MQTERSTFLKSVCFDKSCSCRGRPKKNEECVSCRWSKGCFRTIFIFKQGDLKDPGLLHLYIPGMVWCRYY